MNSEFCNRYQGFECRVCLVRENVPNRPNVTIRDADDVFRIVGYELAGCDREVVLSILLTSRNTVIGVETVFMGALNACIVSPREIFKSAILANAASMIICHNHPSGDLAASEEDISLTKKLVQAGELLQIKILDHVIVSHEGYKSIMPQTGRRKPSYTLV